MTTQILKCLPNKACKHYSVSGGDRLERNIAPACMCYCILKLKLCVVAMVTIFVTILVMPPIIQICVEMVSVLCGGFYQLEADKSVIQKKE